MSDNSLYCVSCGARNRADAAFCDRCGKPLARLAETAATTVAESDSRGGRRNVVIGIVAFVVAFASAAIAFPGLLPLGDNTEERFFAADSGLMTDASLAIPLPERDRAELVAIDPNAPQAVATEPPAKQPGAVTAPVPQLAQHLPSAGTSTAANANTPVAAASLPNARDTVDRLAAARAAANRDARARAAQGNASPPSTVRDDAPIASGRNMPADAPISSGRTSPADAPISSGRTLPADAPVSSGRTDAEPSIPVGATFALKSLDQVCTDKNKIGDKFLAETTHDVAGVNGATIPKGTKVVFSVDRLHRSTGGNDKTDFSVAAQNLVVNGNEYAVSAKLDTVVLKQKSRGLMGGLLGVAAGAAAAKAAGGGTGAVVAGAAAGGTAGTLIGRQLGNNDGCLERNALVRISLLSDLRLR